MECASCTSQIKSGLSQIDGVKSVEVNFATERVDLQFDPSKTNLDQMTGKIAEMGYTAHPVHKLRKTSGTVDRSLMWLTFALVVSILGALPLLISMFVELATGALMPPLWQAILATIVQVVGGYLFYKGAIKGLLHKSANMDLLVAIGTSVAYVYSLVNYFLQLADGEPRHFYFETSAVIIAFVLLGKYMENFAKSRARKDMKALVNMQSLYATVIRNGLKETIPIDQVAVKDVVIVRLGEHVPVDGIVVTGEAAIDESLLTGEPVPVAKEKGILVFAGTIIVQGYIEIEVQKLPQESLLSKMVELIDEAQKYKGISKTLIDQVSKPFILTVLSLSLLTWLLWTLIAHKAAFGLIAAVAVLIIACPCAIGLATPMVIMVSASRAARIGILVKDFGSLEMAGKTNVMIFDKTGTLTIGKPEVVDIQPPLAPDGAGRLYSLAKASTHPISQAIAKHLEETIENPPAIDQVAETAGKGVKGTLDGQEYYLGSGHFIQEHTQIEPPPAGDLTQVLFADHSGNPPTIIQIEDKMKEDAPETVAHLKKKGIKSVILSGDKEGVVKRLAEKLQIEEYYAEQTPEEKLRVVQEHMGEKQTVAVMGDGTNDAPALKVADVGMAVFSGTDLAMDSAGIGLMRHELNTVLDVIHLGKLSRRKLKQNIFLAFIYNIIAIPVAAFGLLNPMIAAIAMSLSSLSVVVNALSLRSVGTSKTISLEKQLEKQRAEYLASAPPPEQPPEESGEKELEPPPEPPSEPPAEPPSTDESSSSDSQSAEPPPPQNESSSSPTEPPRDEGGEPKG